MSTKLILPLSALAVVLGALNASAQNTAVYFGGVTTTALVAAESPIQKPVEAGPRYDLQRKYLVSGGRVTLYANFLRDEAGVVLFMHHGVSLKCNLVAWRPNSVTVDLPKVGLPGPQRVEIVIVLPDGRIAKTFRTICEPQPDFLVHSDSIPRATPPVHRGCGVYLK